MFGQPKGIRIPFEKSAIMTKPTMVLQDVSRAIIPFCYPTDAEIERTASLYDTVRRGTPLSQISGDPTAQAYASMTGTISGEKTVFHPLYGDLRCAVIDCLPEQSETPNVPTDSVADTPAAILEAVKAAGIIDETDGIPLYSKLKQWREIPCDFLVADAVEVGAYACSAWATLRDGAEEVLEGLRLAAACIDAPRYHIAACLSGKRYRSLSLRIDRRYLYQTADLYPTPALVKRGRRVRLHTVRYQDQVCRVGVQACRALYRAVRYEEPHSTTILTVAGDAIASPCNVQVPFGTSLSDVLRRCGIGTDPDRLILGEMMTGVSALTQDIPVLPGMTCVLAFCAPKHKPLAPRPCIGCGRCVSVCHADLLPFEIFRRAENLHDERLSSLAVSDCDGCGACSYVCPCGLDLAAAVRAAREQQHSILLNVGGETDA